MNAPVQCVRKKGKTISVSDDFISAVQYKINRRPRKKLNFLSPKEVFFNLII